MFKIVICLVLSKPQEELGSQYAEFECSANFHSCPIIFNEGLSDNLNRSAQSEITTNIKAVSITVADQQAQIDTLREQEQELINISKSLITFHADPPDNSLTSKGGGVD
jgi:hypothetical protein